MCFFSFYIGRNIKRHFRFIIFISPFDLRCKTISEIYLITINDLFDNLLSTDSMYFYLKRKCIARVFRYLTSSNRNKSMKSKNLFYCFCFLRRLIKSCITRLHLILGHEHSCHIQMYMRPFLPRLFIKCDTHVFIHFLFCV